MIIRVIIYRKTAYLKRMCYLCTKLKKSVMKEAFEHLKRYIFNSYMDHLLLLYPLVMDFCRSSLGYALIMNYIMCLFFC